MLLSDAHSPPLKWKISLITVSVKLWQLQQLSPPTPPPGSEICFIVSTPSDHLFFTVSMGMSSVWEPQRPREIPAHIAELPSQQHISHPGCGRVGGSHRVGGEVKKCRFISGLLSGDQGEASLQIASVYFSSRSRGIVYRGGGWEKKSSHEGFSYPIHQQGRRKRKDVQTREEYVLVRTPQGSYYTWNAWGEGPFECEEQSRDSKRIQIQCVRACECVCRVLPRAFFFFLSCRVM